jgi:DNA-binding response OmpR family regulator
MPGPRVLIIDDDKMIVTLMTALLRKEGFEVISAFDGASGYMAAQKQHPDLILLDMQMPAGGGASVRKRLHDSGHTNGIPVVYVTATAEPGFAEQVIAEGAAGFIQKPFDPETFGARVRSFFRRSTGETRAIPE